MYNFCVDTYFVLLDCFKQLTGSSRIEGESFNPTGLVTSGLFDPSFVCSIEEREKKELIDPVSLQASRCSHHRPRSKEVTFYFVSPTLFKFQHRRPKIEGVLLSHKEPYTSQWSGDRALCVYIKSSRCTVITFKEKGNLFFSFSFFFKAERSRRKTGEEKRTREKRRKEEKILYVFMYIYIYIYIL